MAWPVSGARYRASNVWQKSLDIAGPIPIFVDAVGIGPLNVGATRTSAFIVAGSILPAATARKTNPAACPAAATHTGPPPQSGPGDDADGDGDAVMALIKSATQSMYHSTDGTSGAEPAAVPKPGSGATTEV